MANTRKVGLKIEVDGEREYKQAISELNRDNAVLASELKKVQEQYKGNEDSMDALRAKSEIFQDQLATQSRKVEETRERLDAWRAKLAEVREQFGATSEQYLTAQKNVQEYEIKLNNAQTQEIRLERALEETNRALDQQGEAMEEAGAKTVGLGDGLDSIAGKLGIQIPDAAKEALNGVSGFSAATVAEFTGAAGAIGAAYEVGKKLFDLTVEAAAQADALLTRSAQTGLDTSTLQGLDYASRFVDFENADKTLAKFTQSMAAANEGTKAQAEAFDRLGVAIVDEDGHLLNNYDTFLAAIDALGQVENATERDAIANDLFGKSYLDLKPLVDAGTDALKAYMDEAEELGYIIDEKVVQKLGALDDAMQKNEASSTALKTTVAGELAPTFTLLVDTATAAQDAFRNLMDNGFVEFITTAGMSSNPIGAFLTNFKSLADRIYGVKNAQSETAETVEEDSGRMAEAIAQATESATADIGALRDAYDASYEAAKKSLDRQFSLWEQAGEVTATSTSDMLAGLQSQIDYWNTYEENFNSLVSRNIEGIEEFAQNFDDGSQASAEALAGLKNATDEEIRQIIAKMAETDDARSRISDQFAKLEEDVSGRLKKMREEYGQTVTDINTKTGEIDFAPFDAAVEAAFGGMELRAATAADNAVATVQAAIDRINNMQISPQIDQGVIYSDMNAGYNAAGTDSWRGGLTWVGESGPELVRLPQGTQIIPNQQSKQIASAGTDTRAMEGLLGQVVNLLGEIRAERQAESMRGRMR